MIDISDMLDTLIAFRETPCVSGRERDFAFMLEDQFYDFADEVRVDRFGNVIFFFHGKADRPKKLLIEAHMDEIGFCVEKICEKGFLIAHPCGGIDPEILPGCEVKIWGKETLCAVCSEKPPHLKSADDAHEKIKFDQIFLDTGFQSTSYLKTLVQIGDPITFSAPPEKLFGDRIVSPGLDNKASVLALLLAMKKLKDFPPEFDTYFLFSVGEETTSLGVRNFCREVKCDRAVVVDVGFGFMEGLDSTRCIELGLGPAVSYSGELSREVTEWVIDTAKSVSIPLQILAEPGGTGTSASTLQMQNSGIPSALISIPLLNMHTPSEIVSQKDIDTTAELIVHLCQKTEVEHAQ